MAVRALAEGNTLRATARIVQVDKDTVYAWLDRVAHHCRTVMLSLWHNLHVRECQLDELWGFVHTKEAHLPGAKLYCATYGDGLGVGRVCAGVAPGVSFRDRQAGPSQRGLAVAQKSVE